jgi:predicted  nucleic acid-binding Zn-ribbon protein
MKEKRICVKCLGKMKRTHNTENFEKGCPKCGNNQKYYDRKVYNRSMKENWLCKKCATKESSKYVDRSFQKTNKYRQMMSKSCKGKKHTEETKEKLRLAKLNQIRSQGIQHTYNPNACRFINDFGEKKGYHFRHAMNGGEVIVAGYSLDGYDKEKNIVFEYDEPKHDILSIKQKDIIRQKRIIKKISPFMFIRFNEKHNKLYDVISGKELII